MTHSLYERLSTRIGQERFFELLARCTVQEAIPQALADLNRELRSAHQRCMRCETLEALGVWRRVEDEWWFDADYLGHELDAVQRSFALFEAYGYLPRSRGTGHKLEEWVKSQNIEQASAAAAEQLSVLLAAME